MIRVGRRRYGLHFHLDRLESRVTPTFGAVGPEMPINAIVQFDQITHESARSVAIDGLGQSVVAWSSGTDSLGTYGVYARRFSPAGVPLGGDLPVSTYTTGDQWHASVACDADGDFVVVWSSVGQDGSGEGIYARRYDAQGTPLGGEFRVNTETTFDQSLPTVAMAANGRFVVAWQNLGGGDLDISAQRFGPTGVPEGGEFLVNAYTFGTQAYPSAAMDADGDFVVSWTSFAGTEGLIYARRFAANGVPASGDMLISSESTGDQRYPSVAVDADGDFVVAWHADLDSNSFGIYARRFSATGVPLDFNAFQANTITTLAQIYPSVAMDANGDFAITWTSSYGDGSGFGIYARRYVGGTAQGPEFRVNQYVNTNQINPSVSMDADGDFMVAWSSYYQDTSFFGVYAQRYRDADNNEDTAGPVVANVFANSSAGPVLENQVVAGPVASLRVTFSEAVSTAGGSGGAHSVTNPANWALSRNGMDVSSQIAGIGYTIDARSEATITLASPLAPGQYVLTARAGIQDLETNGLDGDFDGQGPASDFARQFVIAAPSVLSVTVNDGSPQRSRVTSITVAVDPALSLPGNLASAFELKRQGSGAIVSLNAGAAGNVVTLTFAGGPVDGGSLADGRYTLTVFAAQIANFDGNGDGTTGDDFVLVGNPATPPKLYRLFGDSDGDGDVDTTDFAAFRTAFGGSSSIFDFDNDGDVDTSDFGQFRARFGASV